MWVNLISRVSVL